MATKQFTDAAIKALLLTKSPKDRYEVFDGNGFGIRVGQRSRTFLFLYHFKGKSRRVSLGKYPDMSLADAGVALAAAKKLLEGGIDPGAKAVADRRSEREAETVAELVEEYLERYAYKNKKSADEDERILRKDVLPAIGRLKAKEVRRRDIVKILDAITDRGAPVIANRTKSVVSRMFRFAVSRDIVDANPVVEIDRNKETARERVLSDEEIRRVWTKLDDAPMSAATQFALKFMLVTGQRKGEVVAAERDEIDGDIWEIPGSRTKSGRTHRVPLSSLARELLETIKVQAGDSPYLFPSPHLLGKPISPQGVDGTFLKALPCLGIESVTPHDLRRTCATGLGSLGVDRFIIGRILNHAERGVTGQVYDKFSYEPQKSIALEKWGQRLREIIMDEPAAPNVVEFKATR